MAEQLAASDYRALAELRYQIRRFLHFSEEAAHSVGLEARQHQLMLAIKGLPSGARPIIGTVAERMQIQHHSAVELVNRLVRGGYVVKKRCDGDHREVLLSLTARGEKVLRDLSLQHHAELGTRGPELVQALKRTIRAKTIRAKTIRAGNAPSVVRTGGDEL